MTNDSSKIPSWLKKLTQYGKKGPAFERVTSGHYGSFRLPPEKGIHFEELDESFLLVGEKASGIEEFIAWLKSEAGAKVVKEQGKGQSWLTLSLRHNPSYMRDIDPWEEIEKGGFFLVDRTYYDPNSKDDEAGSKLAKLVGYLEEPEWLAENRLICATHEVADLMRETLFTNILLRTHSYRPHQLDEDDLKQWVVEMKKHKELQVSEVSNEFWQIIKKLSGGQPKLTLLLFVGVTRRIEEKAKQSGLSTEDLEEIFQEEADLISVNPPAFVYQWKESLTALVQDPECYERLASYVEGETKPFSSGLSWKETQLYLTGWLGESAQSWQIRSSLHRDWAAGVLEGGQ